MTRLCAIFDIDGTLCDTSAVDEECYRQAAAAVLEVPTTQVDWSCAPHWTDSGIARWLWERWCGRAPNPEEVDRFRGEFLRRLETERLANVHRFQSIRAAPQFLDALGRLGVLLGIATGGWRLSAELKLTAAGLGTDLLYATADDAEARTDIFSLAWSRATAHSQATSTVLIGDGIWDVATARHLGWRFLGVGTGARALRLQRAGAATVVPDFVGLEAHDILQRARIPLGLA